MPKEPYNLFSNAGSTLPGGGAYEDLLVILKAAIQDAGGSLEISEEHLMHVDRDEAIRVDDVFLDGRNRKVFSIQTKLPNQNPEGHIRHEQPEPQEELPLGAKIIASLLWVLIVVAVIFLLGQVVRALT